MGLNLRLFQFDLLYCQAPPRLCRYCLSAVEFQLELLSPLAYLDTKDEGDRMEEDPLFTSFSSFVLILLFRPGSSCSIFLCALREERSCLSPKTGLSRRASCRNFMAFLL